MTRTRVAKVIGGLLTLLVSGLVVMFTYANLVANPRVAEGLRADPNGEMAQRVMLLTLPSGRELPVNYLQRDDLVFAGADGGWWRELDGEGWQEVEVYLRGEKLSGRARAERENEELREDVFSELRPAVPLIFGVLIVITLDPS